MMYVRPLYKIRSRRTRIGFVPRQFLPDSYTILQEIFYWLSIVDRYMDLQNWFYLIGVIYMIVGIIILIVIGVVLIMLKQKITHLTETIEQRVEMVSRIVADPTDVAFSVGSHFANKAIKKVKKMMSK